MKRLVGALLLVLTVAGLSGCGADPSASGTLVRSTDATKGIRQTLIVPLATIDFEVGTPVDSLKSGDVQDATSHDAPDGGAFVPVTWSPSPISGTLGQLGAADKTATLALVAGGHSYRLGTVGRVMNGPYHVYVAVADDHDLQVAATYDGLTQTVDVTSGKRDAGVAAALYQKSGDGTDASADCGEGWTTDQGFTAQIGCTADVASVPWAGAWAGDGQTFETAAVTVDVTSLSLDRDESAFYTVTGVTDQSTIDDAAPVTPMATSEAGQIGGRLTAQVPASGQHVLHLKLTCTVQRESGGSGSPSQATVTLEQDVDLGGS